MSSIATRQQFEPSTFALTNHRSDKRFIKKINYENEHEFFEKNE